jgi:hypothetical protein
MIVYTIMHKIASMYRVFVRDRQCRHNITYNLSTYILYIQRS